MKNFKDYEELIRNKVKEINDKDTRWKWSIKFFDEHLVCIQWGYLDYCEEKDNYFRLSLMDDVDVDGDSFITARTPQNNMIEGYFATEEIIHSWQSSWESVLISALEDIASYAHSRY